MNIILSLFFYRNDKFNVYFVYSSEENHQTTCNTSTCTSRANQNASKPTGEFKVPTSAHTPKLEKVHATWVYSTRFIFKRCMLFHPNTSLKIEIGNARISKTSLSLISTSCHQHLTWRLIFSFRISGWLRRSTHPQWCTNRYRFLWTTLCRRQAWCIHESLILRILD